MPREPKPTTRKTPPKTNLIFISHLLLFLALAIVLYVFVPPIDQSVKEWELKAPAPTAFVIRLSRLVVSYWYLTPFLAASYYFVLLGVRKLDHRRPGLATFWTVLIWYAGAFFLIFTAISLVIPFISGTRALAP